ncbi:Isocitrate dehydrogenase [NAD] subunit, mitochondrial [Aphelenchoides besseyi]|nr:Isocitrate dehydrogenase [NAD] subunit, mitochondrial [Aphelenchoides besseyi]
MLRISRALTTNPRNFVQIRPLATTQPVTELAEKIKVTLIPGDGVGPELIYAVQDLVKHTGIPLAFDEVFLSEVHHTRSSSVDDVVASITRNNRVALKGVIQESVRRDYSEDQGGLNMQLRRRLDLFANVVHIKSLDGIKTRHGKLDFTIIREQTEGEYSALEHESVPGIIECLKITTRTKAERIAKFGFDYATKLRLKKVTAVHKANIMKLGDGLFLNVCKEMAKLYPAIKFEQLIVDNACMQLVSNPSQFNESVLVMPNLYGNIIDNLAAGLVGGAGVVPGQSIGSDFVIFEPGSRHSYFEASGRQIANPTAMFLCTSNLLRHLNLDHQGIALRAAVKKTIADGRVKTRDLGGYATTSEFTSSVIDNYLERLESLPPHARVISPSSSHFFNESSAYPKTETHSRRGRLALVRSRMRSEFGLGGGNFGGSEASVDDVSQSDCTSISSWGRRLLLETGNDLACPADTLSTRASVSQWVESVPGPSLTPSAELSPSTIPTSRAANNRPLPPPLPPRRIVLDAVQENEDIPQTPPAVVSSVSSPKRNHNSTSSYPDPKIQADEENLYAKKRGHAKTKSLDRGLSLAKAMKCGPFPPPASSNKSSSLNRGVSPGIVNATEEDQREDAAHAAKYPSHDANRDLPLVSEESSTASSTPVRSKSTLTEIKQKANEIERTEVAKTMSTKLTNNRSSHKRYVSCVERDAVIATNSGFKECRSASALHEYAENAPQRALQEPTSPTRRRLLTQTQSIDPITQDVERRMSVKDHYSTRSSSHSGELSRDHSMHSIHSSIGNARAWMRSQASLAQTFLRGAYQKARTAVASGSTPKCRSFNTKDEDEVLESDAASSSVSMSVSESNIKSYGRTIDGYPIICRPKSAKKGPNNFRQLRVVQELNNEHTGAVWCVKFSTCGRLLATAGHDNMVRVWVLRNHLSYFLRLRNKYNQQSGNGTAHDFERIMQMEKKSSIGAYEDDNSSVCSRKSPMDSSASTKSYSTQAQSSQNTGTSSSRSNYGAVFAPKPFSVYRGHTSDVLDLSWSPKNYFLLSSGMDHTVRLYHLTRPECLCCFQHADYVTGIAFMPKDDRYFVSGSLDGKIRLWNISEKKVTLWNEVDQTQFVTAICAARRYIVVGTYDGRCFFYTNEGLRYHTVLNVRSSRGKTARKISSLAVYGDYLLVTSNDSRIRMYSLSNLELVRKFKGAQIERSQIRASFSPDGEHVICGSEDNFAYVWSVSDPSTALLLHNTAYERIRAHSSVVTAAIFAPRPQLFFSLLSENPSQLAPVVTTAYSKRAELSVPNQTVPPQCISPVANSDVASVKSQSRSGRLFSAASARASQLVNDLRHPRRNILNFRNNGSVKNSTILGDIIVTADQNGSIKILANPRQLPSSQSTSLQLEMNKWIVAVSLLIVLLSVVSAADDDENIVMKTRKQLGVYSFVSPDYPAAFAIVAGISIILAIAVVFIVVGLLTTKPPTDSIIYRMTNTRAKRE